MEEADRIVSAPYPDAVLVAADGKPASGMATVAEDYNEWLFIFQLFNKNESVTIHCLDEAFGPPQHHPHPVLNVMHESLPRTLSLDGAIGLARRAGFNNAFKSVSLFKSTLPGTAEASYVFTPLFLLVGATSSTVHEEL
jgi:hypothetical protein